MIFEDNEKIIDVFCDVLSEVPYIALASKKTLFNTFNSCLAQTDGIGVSEKDVQQFASNIFEINKPIKEDTEDEERDPSSNIYIERLDKATEENKDFFTGAFSGSATSVFVSPNARNSFNFLL